MRLFFSYSHEDESLRNELEIHLAPLRREGVIESWHDRRIPAGEELNTGIADELESSDVILLLVSAYFLDSDYCYEREMKRALEKHDEGSAIVIPVILHPCDWRNAPFGGLKATPTDGKAVSKFPNLHEAFAIVAHDVRAAIEARDKSVARWTSPTPKPSLCKPNVPVADGPRSSNLRIKRQFSDHERDEFLESSYEFILRYFDGSLDELSTRNTQINTKLRRIDKMSFSVVIYDAGKKVTQCCIWYGKKSLGSTGIAYLHAEEARDSSFNEFLTIEDDGYTLFLKPIGMGALGQDISRQLTQAGAAEYYWAILMRPLQ